MGTARVGPGIARGDSYGHLRLGHPEVADGHLIAERLIEEGVPAGTVSLPAPSPSSGDRHPRLPTLRGKKGRWAKRRTGMPRPLQPTGRRSG